MREEDYRTRISERADICNVRLSYDQLLFLDAKVKDQIKSGSCEADALDYCYFYIKENYV